MPDPGIARRIYELQLERAHLRAMRAVVLHHRGAPGDRDPAELDQTIAELDATLRAAESADDDAPMARLAARFGLDDVERDLVWTVVASVAEPRFALHATALIGSEGRRGLTLTLFALIAGLDGPTGRALALRLGARHPLFRFQLVDPGERPDPVAGAVLRPSTRLLSYLAGEHAIDPLLLAVGAEVPVPEHAIFDAVQQAALRRIAEALGSREPVVLIVEGPTRSGRRTAVATVAARDHRGVIAVDVKQLAPTLPALEDALAALRREALLGGRLPLVAEVDDLIDASPEGGHARARALARVLDDTPGPVVLTVSRPGLELPLQRRILRVDWPVPDTASRRALWRRALGDDGAAIVDADIEHIALRYRLGAGGIERATASARLLSQARGGGALDATDLISGIRNDIAESLGSLARRVEVKQTWKDLVLSPDLLGQIHALIARIRHAHRVYEDWGFGGKVARGIGVPALFSGPPGTGKTMVAGIIARELDLELLQVDLSQVVSKWLGETEKQLSRVFEAAEAGHALLLFDEADSLFAKRTADVRGANDRYANLEVNYLLQRIESFGGITILTTNLDASIDPALKRRLASHVVFWPPDEDEREDLWRRQLDTGRAPTASDLDLAHLARAYPDMTGANIRNAVLAGAFLAAAESRPITQEHLDRAAKGEYRTMGRVLR